MFERLGRKGPRARRGRSRKRPSPRSAARRRTCMDLIACAASSSIASRTVENRCGQLRLVDRTDRPAVRLEPMLRVCLPSTFMLP